MSSDLVRAHRRRAARADRASGWPTTCPRDGWRRSTTATPRRSRPCAPSSTTRRGAPRSASRASPPRRGRRSTAPGSSLAPGQARAVNEVINQYRVPRPTNIIGIGMGGPTVIAWGSEELKQQFLRGIATNEEIWCQLFSEPGAGSDVAGLATRAERDGDEWVVNGQKVWTSLAHLARYGMLLAAHRSRPAQAQGPELLRGRHAPARRRGAAAAPDHRRRRVQRGVLRERAHPRRVAPRAGRRGVAGRHHHADERAGVALGPRLGERRHHRRQPRAAGHRPVRARRRRRPAAAPGGGVDRPPPDRARTTSAPPTGAGAARRPGPRGRSPSCRAPSSTSGCRSWRSTSRVPTASRGRARASSARRRSASSVAARDGPRTVARGFLRAQANTIEGGTSAIMRNILGERVLGLPKDPDQSRDVPWKDVPRSG